MSLVQQFKDTLTRSRQGFLGRLGDLFGGGEIDEEFYEELEEILVSGDVGVQTTLKLVEELREEIAARRIRERSEARELLEDILGKLLQTAAEPVTPEQPPLVILLVGVNGSGKTTSIAKLAHFYKQQGKKVLLVAGDTFRAAAVEQLEIWAKRAGVDIIKQQQGTDPAALYFDAVNAAVARKADVLIGDTAGRLHTSDNLMDELNKIYRVINRNLEGAPHQVLLTVDATTGHNAVAQAEKFNQTLPLTGLILTKLDGTARGGIVVGIRDQLDIPVSYIGTGEKIEDLAPFDPRAFTAALLQA